MKVRKNYVGQSIINSMGDFGNRHLVAKKCKIN
jgi:hypothetical protein